MTMDLTGIPGEIMCADQAASQEAIASSDFQHAEGASPRAASPLKLVHSERKDHSPVYYDALAALERAIPNTAAHKNIPVQPQDHVAIARQAIRSLSDDEMVALLSLDPAVVAKARIALSDALDEFAATMLAVFVAYIHGIDNPAPHVIAPLVKAHLGACSCEGHVIIWPDLADAATKHTSIGEMADA